MKLFVGWIKEGEEHKIAFENNPFIRMGQRYLRGTWSVIRKIRLVRLIRRVIEEGIIGRGRMQNTIRDGETGRGGGGRRRRREIYV